MADSDDHHTKTNTIVLYPSPGIGHVVSMVELGKLILHHTQSLTITILLSTGILDSPSLSAYILRISQSHPSIIFIRFPLVPPSTARMSPAAVMFDFIQRNTVNVESALTQISQRFKIKSFIIDFFCPAALTLAQQRFNLDAFYFFTSGAAILKLYLSFPEVHKMGFDKSFRDLKDTFLDIPGLPRISAPHVPEPLLDLEDPAYSYTIFCCEQLARASGILVNTFEGFEPDAEKALSESNAKSVYYIGPLIADPKEHRFEGLAEEDEENGRLFSWLDQQPKESAVLLCFGSRGVFSASQLKEIATGLENSGARFVWAVRSPNQSQTSVDFDLEPLLPAGFLRRTENRGLVIKCWVPQVNILAHSAAGGFVTHCGWNSVLESVVAGVPMVAWPRYAEQFVNRAVMVETMEMAIGIEEDENGFVKASEVEMKVKELMGSEKGRVLRDRSAEMRKMSLAAKGESGPSTAALMKLLQIWNV